LTDRKEKKKRREKKGKVGRRSFFCFSSPLGGRGEDKGENVFDGLVREKKKKRKGGADASHESFFPLMFFLSDIKGAGAVLGGWRGGMEKEVG